MILYILFCDHFIDGFYDSMFYVFTVTFILLDILNNSMEKWPIHFLHKYIYKAEELSNVIFVNAGVAYRNTLQSLFWSSLIQKGLNSSNLPTVQTLPSHCTL